jgi:hypothetical protein
MARDREDPQPFDDASGNVEGRSKQKGQQRHAEGMHGPKARARLLEQLESGESREPRAAPSADHGTEGKHRLFEQREQHDEADRNSEKNRLSRDISAHGHNRDNFQVPGGSGSSRAERRNPINPGDPDAPTPGEPMPPPPDRTTGRGR